MKRNNGFLYLASPYSHPDKAIRDWRIEQVFKATVKLMNEGHLVFSPIVHTHQLEERIRPDLARQHSFWMKQDIALLRHAADLYILMLPGWIQSKGVSEEIDIAHICQIPVTYYELDNEALQ